MPLTMAAARATFQLWGGKIYKKENFINHKSFNLRVGLALPWEHNFWALPYH